VAVKAPAKEGKANKAVAKTLAGYFGVAPSSVNIPTFLRMLECLWYDASMAKGLKTAKQMERHLKGVANHRRIEILSMVAQNAGLTVEEIADRLDCNFKTISEHTRRLAQAGLINKEYKGRNVAHTLSPYGRTFYDFLKRFQQF